MSDQPENIVLVFLRRLDARMDLLVEDMRDVKLRFTILETRMGQMAATEASHPAALASRRDRLEQRLDRIERRLDLVESP